MRCLERLKKGRHEMTGGGDILAWCRARLWVLVVPRLKRRALLAAAFGLSAATLAGQGLEVVPPPASGEIEVVRDRQQTVSLQVRNTDTAAVDIQSLYYRGQETPAVPGPRVVGLDGISLAAGQITTVALVLPAYPGVGEYQGGIYLRPRAGPESDEPFFSLKIKVVEPYGRVLSPKKAGWLASLAALLVIALTLYVRVPVGDGSGAKLNFFQAPSPHHDYSVSRFQVWLWTVVILFSYCYLFLSRSVSPDFPDSVWAVLGISVASIGTATALAVKGQPGAPAPAPAAPGAAVVPEPPAGAGPNAPALGAPAPPPPPQPSTTQSALVNMLSESGKPSIMRLQMFAWTIVVAALFVKHVYATGLLWDIPTNLLILMGISHGGYLVDKAAGQPRT